MMEPVRRIDFAAGVTAYAALHLLGGRAREVSPAVWILAALFLLRYFLT
jgi:AGZA family xanthine/uracil permease-like MFS transporter